MTKNQCISGSTDGAQQLHAKVVDNGNVNDLMRVTSAKEREMEPPNSAKERAIALVLELHEVQDAQKQSVGAARECNNWAANAASQLAESLLRSSKAAENARVGSIKLVDMQYQMAEFTKSANDAQRRLSKILKRRPA